jgi:tyrosine-protein phosphatase SIW14
MKNSFFRSTAAMFLAAIVGLSAVSAQTHTEQVQDLSKIDIGNFGQMDDRLYRGAQPEPDDYASLAAIGIKTIVDLRNDPTDYEKAAAEANGMKYVNIPMSGWKYPDDEDVEAFMALMNNPETGKVYVHCKAGKHRTGLVGAIYRFNNYDWSYDQAYKEMKKYNYTSWPVHFNIKSYVKSYSKQYEKEKSRSAAAAARAAAVRTATATAGVAN